MAMLYLECLRDLTPLTDSNGTGKWFYRMCHTIVVAGWLLYALTWHFAIFTGLFTVQVIVAAIVSLKAGIQLGVPRHKFYCFVTMIALARLAWETERYLWRQKQCPTDIGDPLYWLHSMWHVGSGAAHCLWTGYAGELQRARVKALEGSGAKGEDAETRATQALRSMGRDDGYRGTLRHLLRHRGSK